MQTFGRLRLDVENCVNELADFGVAKGIAGTPMRYAAARPDNAAVEKLLDRFLERRAAISTEDQSPSVQRFREMIGRDEKMLIVFEWIRTAAKSDISVLILGPTGSGKELVGAHDPRAEPAAGGEVPGGQLRGAARHAVRIGNLRLRKGAFTGAHDRKPGRLELANEGTLFLDEIGDLSIIAQAKLLRVLEDRRFERLGGNKSIHVDFRLISATNRPLDQFVRDGRFREDLYYRVNAFSIRLPSLRERQVDIPVLAQRFLARYCAANGLPLDAKTLRARGRRFIAGLPLAGKHSRARKHRVARRALCAGPIDSARPTSSSFTRANRRPKTTASVCRRSAKPNARTSSASSTPSAGTKKRRRASSKSAAERSTARSSNSVWNRR